MGSGPDAGTAVSYTHLDVYKRQGEKKETLGRLNPFRYRGYVYDEETGLYYVSSRYYDPEVGRWINADDTDILAIDQGTPLQYNLFSYCHNNPVNMADLDGYIPFFVITGIIGAVAGGIIGYATTGSWKGAVAGAARCV